MTTEEGLLKYFQQFAEVEDTTIIRTSSGRRKGFASVRFREAKDITIMCKEHNIDGHLVTADMDSTYRNVQISPIPSNMTVDTLREYFSTFGDIKWVIMSQSKRFGCEKQQCMIVFCSQSDAYQVVEIHVHEICGYEVLAEFKALNQQPNKLEIVNLPYNTTVDDLKEYFSDISGLKEIDLHIQLGKKQCSAFLTFNDKSSVDSIVRRGEMKFGSSYIKGKPMRNGLYGNARLKSLLIENLPLNITKTDLINHFSDFGAVKGATLVSDAEEGSQVGTIVKFKYISSVKKAVSDRFHAIELNHYPVRQLGLIVDHSDQKNTLKLFE